MATKKNPTPASGEITKNLKNLETVVAWFTNQTDVDIEQGLTKVKQGAELIKTLKQQLAEVENEFQVIKKDLDISS